MTARYFHHVWQVLLELSPWLLGGLAMAGLLHGLLPPRFIERHLGCSRFTSVLKAVLLGVPMPLCSCGVIPAALGIRRQGASNGAAIGFLISTPQTGVDSILVSGAFLGWPFAWFKVFSALLTGLLGGALTQAVDRAAPVPDDAGPSACRGRVGPVGMLDYAVNDLLHMIWIWIVVGVLVSAAISTWVPDDYLAGTALGGPLAPLLVLVVSLPLYVCATSSVPIAASMVAAGMPTGAALVFLMAGPASNVATIGAVYRGFGGRVLGVYLATIMLGSLVLGYAFDFVLEGAGAVVHPGGHGHGLPGLISALVLLGLFAWFGLRAVHGRYRRRRAAAGIAGGGDGGEELALAVGGMRCGGCVQRVQSALQSQAGVSGADVDLDAGRVTVRGRGLGAERLADAVRAAGFTAESL